MMPCSDATVITLTIPTSSARAGRRTKRDTKKGYSPILPHVDQEASKANKALLVPLVRQALMVQTALTAQVCLWALGHQVLVSVVKATCTSTARLVTSISNHQGCGTCKGT